ncbi:hypothetical protein FACS1894132_03540 [Clostridia bacterium]|nr:hypothetical protein FACS1894132_03540 [Clostridia bacterium]
MFKHSFYIFSAILIHEIAHLITMSFWGVKIKNFSFIGAGIILTPTDDFRPKYQDFLIAISGCFMNFFIAIVFANINETFALCNLYLGLLNIMPSRNLDGGTAILKIFNSLIFLRILSFLMIFILIIYILIAGFNIFLCIITYFLIIDTLL